MRYSIIILYFLIFAVAVHAQQYGRVIYVSPDNKLEAIVTPVHTQELGFNEHRIEIREISGKDIATNDHSSSDHEHGYGIVFAGWTPDSLFFVYSVHSSGGHSAWHFPTHVYVRSRSAFFHLDEVIDRSFVVPQFLLSAPNHFYSQRLSDKGYGHPNVPVRLDLNDVKWPVSK